MKKNSDYGVYLVTDRRICSPRTVDELVIAAVRGGATMVQLREKDLPTKSFINAARKVREILNSPTVPLIINDRVDVALACRADGVHIGQNDMPYRDARRLMGPDAIIGLSVETMEQAMEAQEWDVDYLGVSPVFHTTTKDDTTAQWGLAGLKMLRSKSRHPLVAIGGIKLLNAKSVIEAGADGLAIVSAICGSSDPEGTTRKFLECVRSLIHPMA
jgi:thiamine-phosphate pyrophosphorylase